MLLTSLLPLLTRYSLCLDLVAGADGVVTLTVIPRKAEGVKHDLDAREVRPISIIAPIAEIEAELAKGEGGALGQLFAVRKALGDQLAEQRQAAEDAKSAAAKSAAKSKAKPAPAPAKGASPAKSEAPAAPAAPPTDTKPGEPVSLW